MTATTTVPSARPSGLGRYDVERHALRAGDGRRIEVVHVLGASPPTRDPVLLVHGAGVRADIFTAPVDVTIVDALLDAGYDVWLENWRASIDLAACEWFLDDAAVHDHPVAVRAVLDHTGADSIQAIIHCQGSTSFMMAAVSGLLPGVSNVVSNAVSLHPIIPRVSEFKLHRVSPIVARFLPYIDPQWGEFAESRLERAIVAFVKLTHRECDNNVCRVTSFTYGTGFPCLWSHDNLSDATHEWLRGEFAAVPLTFFEQMSRCVERGHLVSMGRHDELAPSLVAERPRTDARFTFVAGSDNLCFLPESQRRTFEFFEQFEPGRHSFHEFAGFGHLDVFMGDRAATHTFPTIIGALQ